MVKVAESALREDAYVKILTGYTDRPLNYKDIKQTCFVEKIACFHRER